MLDNLPKWSKVTISQLIVYNVHIGHSVANTTPYSAWMLYGIRDGIHLINLFKFIYMFRAGLFAVEGTIRGKGPIWFVNLDKSSSLLVKYPAQYCGEYWVINNWIRGMVSNYRIICKSVRRVYRIGVPAWNRKIRLLESNFSNWGYTRNSWPRALFVSNVKESYGPCHESHKLRIPCLGIVDTNAPMQLVSIAIPGNDESINSLAFYNSLLSTFILYKKFAYVHSWYSSQLNKQNNLNSQNKKMLNILENIDTISNFYSNVSINPWKFFWGSLNLLSAQGLWQIRKIENIVYSKKLFINNFQLKINNFLSKNKKLFIFIGKSLSLSKQIIKSINFQSQKWFLNIKDKMQTWNQISVLRRKNSRAMTNAFTKDRFFRKALQVAFRKSQQPSEYSKLWSFYQLFNIVTFPILSYYKNIFKKKYNRLKKRSIKIKKPIKRYIILINKKEKCVIHDTLLIKIIINY